MQRRFLLNYLFAFVLIICSASLSNCAKPHHENTNQTIATIHARKSVRDYTTQSIPDSLLLRFVEAGMAAPSGLNKQPWHFIVVTERAKLDSLASRLPSAKMLFKAPAAIVVAGDQSLYPEELKDYWVQDCSAASQNILLAIESEGLGGVWTGAWLRDERIKPIQEVLEMPSHIVPLNVIAIGYPAKEEKPKSKFKKEKVHWNRY